MITKLNRLIALARISAFSSTVLMAASGHEERFPSHRLSGRCGLTRAVRSGSSERLESGRVSDAGRARASRPGVEGRRPKATEEGTRGTAASSCRLWGLVCAAALAGDGFAEIGER